MTPHFAIAAPVLGWLVARVFKSMAQAAKSIALLRRRPATRFFVLHSALAVPDAIPLLPAVLRTQTLVQLLSGLVYV